MEIKKAFLKSIDKYRKQGILIVRGMKRFGRLAWGRLAATSMRLPFFFLYPISRYQR